jgi:hypothetical protein
MRGLLGVAVGSVVVGAAVGAVAEDVEAKTAVALA